MLKLFPKSTDNILLRQSGSQFINQITSKVAHIHLALSAVIKMFDMPTCCHTAIDTDIYIFSLRVF